MKNIFLSFNNVAFAVDPNVGTGGQNIGTGGANFGTGGQEIPNPLGSQTIIGVINNIINYLIYISVPILAIMILIGGFQILTARGEPAKITSGKQTITYAVIGFAIVLVSKGVALILLSIIGG